MSAKSRHKWAMVLAGAHSGSLGEAITLALIRRGINVIATSASTDPTAIEHISPKVGSDDGFLVCMHLDVTSSRSVALVVKHAAELSEALLDFLISSTTASCPIPLLDLSISQARKYFDTQVWGSLRMIQACFPMLRAAKGTIVTQTCSSGVQGLNIPYLGVESSLNAALGSLGDTLRLELAPFNVNVVNVVVPDVERGEKRDRVNEDSVYFPIRERIKAATERVMTSGKDRFQVAEEVVADLLREKSSTSIRKGRAGGFVHFLTCLLPYWILEWVILAASGLETLKKQPGGSSPATKRLE